MLTNEQRAHDLALVAVSIMAKIDTLQIKPETKIDVFTNYMAVYEGLIEAFNREFPPKSGPF